MINLLAYGIAKACKAQGAKIAFTYLNDYPSTKKSCSPELEEFESGDLVYPCDVTKPEILALKEGLKPRF